MELGFTEKFAIGLKFKSPNMVPIIIGLQDHNSFISNNNLSVKVVDAIYYNKL